MVVEGPSERLARIILRGRLAVELNNRFYIIAKDYNTIDMIFSCTYFNVSSVLPRSRVLLVLQVYDVEMQSIIMMRFILNFTNGATARRFYNYVKTETSCTSNIIPVVIPHHIANIDE